MSSIISENIPSRFLGIDAFRILAAVFVVFIHCGQFRDIDPVVFAGLRLSARWAVPFFFIVSGYFMAKHLVSEPGRVAYGAARIAIVFAVANVLLFPLLVYTEGAKQAVVTLFSFGSLNIGVYFHLWFLSSLALAYFFFYVAASFSLKRTAMIVAGLLMFFACGKEYYPTERFDVFFRYMSGIPLVGIGVYLRIKQVNVGAFKAVALVAAGFMIQCLEAYGISAWLGYGLGDHELLFGAVIFAVGIFLLALSFNNFNIIDKLAPLGVRYALGVYILHPYFTETLRAFGDFNGLTGGAARLLSMIVGVFLLVWLIEKLAPVLHDITCGDLRPLSYFDGALKIPKVF